MQALWLQILAWLWIISGAVGAWKPGFFKNRLAKKSLKTVRQLIVAVALTVGGMLLSAGWELKGLPGMLVSGLGIVAIVKAVLFLRAQVADKIIEWFSRKSEKWFRVAALVQVGFGIALFALKRWQG